MHTVHTICCHSTYIVYRMYRSCGAGDHANLLKCEILQMHAENAVCCRVLQCVLQQQHVANNIEVFLQRHAHYLLPPHGQASTDTATSRAIQTNKLTLHFHTTLASMQRLCPSSNPFRPSFLSLIQLAMHKYISFQVEHETRHGQGRDYMCDITQVLRDFC